MIDRRVVIGLPLVLLAACKGQGAATAAATGGAGIEARADMNLGDPNAKVKMIEYQSTACPICMVFNTTVWPEFKAKYVDTGKVYYTSREALTHDSALASAGFMIAHCASHDDDKKYFAVVDTLFRRQTELEAQGADVHAILLDIARQAGMTEAQFNTCINDETAPQVMQQRWEKYAAGDSKAGTPTILINGKNVNLALGDPQQAMAQLSAAVDAALK